MKFLATALAVLSLAASALAQTSAVTVPLGNATFTPPPPPTFTQQVNQAVDVLVLINGVQYKATGTLTGSLTFTVVGGTTPVPPIVPTPPPVGSSAISRITDAGGATINTAPGGTTITVVGTNLGQFGTATVAGLTATVVGWTPLAVKLKLPSAGSATGSASGPVVLKPGDAPVATSDTSFTITALTAELPPVPLDLPTWESPVISVSQYPEGPDGPVPTPTFEQLYLDLPPPILGTMPDADRIFVKVVGYQDKDGRPPTQLVAGETLQILGEGFGTQEGEDRVEVNEQPVTIQSWSNELIVVNTALELGCSVEASSILVWKGLDNYYYGRAWFPVVPISE